MKVLDRQQPAFAESESVEASSVRPNWSIPP